MHGPISKHTKRKKGARCGVPGGGRDIDRWDNDNGQHHPHRWQHDVPEQDIHVISSKSSYLLSCLGSYLFLIYISSLVLSVPSLNFYVLKVATYGQEYWRVRGNMIFRYILDGVTRSGHVNWYDSRGGNLRWVADLGNFENKQNTTDPKLGFSLLNGVGTLILPHYF